MRALPDRETTSKSLSVNCKCMLCKPDQKDWHPAWMENLTLRTDAENDWVPEPRQGTKANWTASTRKNAWQPKSSWSSQAWSSEGGRSGTGWSSEGQSGKGWSSEGDKSGKVPKGWSSERDKSGAGSSSDGQADPYQMLLELDKRVNKLETPVAATQSEAGVAAMEAQINEPALLGEKDEQRIKNLENSNAALRVQVDTLDRSNSKLKKEMKELQDMLCQAWMLDRGEGTAGHA